MEMPDAGSAVYALTAAGNDTEALAEAIEAASFLDETPGEDRQKLREVEPHPVSLSPQLSEALICVLWRNPHRANSWPVVLTPVQLPAPS